MNNGYTTIFIIPQITQNRELFALGVGRVLLAELAVLGKRELLLHLLLVALGVVVDAPARGTLQFRHRVLDLSHTPPVFNCLRSLSTVREKDPFVNPAPAGYVCLSR